MLVSTGPESGGAGVAGTGGILLVDNCPTNNYLDEPGVDMDLVYGGGDIFLGFPIEVELAHNPDTDVAILYIGAGGGPQLGPSVGTSIVWKRHRFLGGDY